MTGERNQGNDWLWDPEENDYKGLGKFLSEGKHSISRQSWIQTFEKTHWTV